PACASSTSRRRLIGFITTRPRRWLRSLSSTLRQRAANYALQLRASHPPTAPHRTAWLRLLGRAFPACGVRACTPQGIPSELVVHLLVADFRDGPLRRRRVRVEDGARVCTWQDQVTSRRSRALFVMKAHDVHDGACDR